MKASRSYPIGRPDRVTDWKVYGNSGADSLMNRAALNKALREDRKEAFVSHKRRGYIVEEFVG